MPTENHADLLLHDTSRWNDWREQHPDIKPNLCGANLSGVWSSAPDLTGVNLSDANLRNANLAGRTLTRANLRGADMLNVNLSGVLLDHADLTNANLRGAQLRDGLAGFRENLSGDPRGAMYGLVQDVSYDGGSFSVVEDGRNDSRYALADPFVVEGVGMRSASMTNAKLEGADLRRAVIVGVSLYATTFRQAKFGDTVIDAYLTDVTDLNMAEHHSRSYLGYRAITSLPQPIPEAFCRGCGMSDWEIDLLKLYNPNLNENQLTDLLYQIHSTRVNAVIQYYSVFISYSHADKPFAKRLHDELQRRGIRCWFDERNILLGDDIYEQVDRGIRLWDKMLLCCSRQSLTSWWVDNEIDTVFEKERRLMKERGEKVLALVPLDLDGYLLSEEWGSGKRRQILSRVAADFRGWQESEEKFQQQLQRVIAALSLDPHSRQHPSERKL